MSRPKRPVEGGPSTTLGSLNDLVRRGQLQHVKGACPLDCPDTCSWVVTVKDGAAVQLRGDARHPYTRGSLCNKVVDYLAYTGSPERVLYPLRRSGPKGSSRFTRISWDAAFDLIAQKLDDAITDYGPEAIWPFVGSGSMGLLQGIYGAGERFWNVLGASRHLFNLCTIAGGFGTGYTLGDNRVGMDPQTFRFARLIVLWGANVLTTHPHLWRPIAEARKAGAYVVTIDPIRTRTAAASDQHLAPIPGTDAALALGLLNVVLSEGREDGAFIDDHTVGWDAFRERIQAFPPDRVAVITGLPCEVVVALGRRLACTRPTAIRIGIGLQRHAGGGMAVRTITCIPGVTGDWQHLGGGAFYDTRGFFGLNWAALRGDGLRRQTARTLLASKLGRTLIDTNDPPVQVLFLYAANPVASAPRQSDVRRGLERPDLFTVVVEHFLTDTASYADVVLPATMATEHQDLLVAYGHLYLSWNEPAVPPPGECLPTTEIFRRLARRMELDEPSLYDSDEEIARQTLTSGHPSLENITLDSLKASGWVRLKYPDPFVPFADGFPTASGKLEFLSERMAEAGLDTVAGYTPSHAGSQGDTSACDHPLTLITPANHFFLNSIFANVPRQQHRSGAPIVVIHPSDARSRDIRAGDEVCVSNPRGSFFAIAEINDSVRAGVIASTKGRWPRDSKHGATINATVDDGTADMGNGALYHDNRVRIDKVL